MMNSGNEDFDMKKSKQTIDKAAAASANRPALQTRDPDLNRNGLSKRDIARETIKIIDQAKRDHLSTKNDIENER